MSNLLPLACFLLLASCVLVPQTIGEASGSLHSLRKYPGCSSSHYSGLTGHFKRPAVDFGNGMIGQVQESFAEGPLIRSGDVVDCQSGLGLLIYERNPVFSDDPAFVSKLDSQFREYADAKGLSDVVALAHAALSDGMDVRPWIWWADEDLREFDDELICGCQLHYPYVKRRWYDSSKMGVEFNKEDGENPKSLSDLEIRLAHARERAMQ